MPLRRPEGAPLRRRSRYTRTRLSSLLTGALSTAVVQSSSVTTLLTIGFVGAGMLSLTSALGVVFGANLGTTLAAWIVSVVGLKVKMNTFALRPPRAQLASPLRKARAADPPTCRSRPSANRHRCCHRRQHLQKQR